jgi:hypothetical protein
MMTRANRLELFDIVKGPRIALLAGSHRGLWPIHYYYRIANRWFARTRGVPFPMDYRR